MDVPWEGCAWPAGGSVVCPRVPFDDAPLPGATTAAGPELVQAAVPQRRRYKRDQARGDVAAHHSDGDFAANMAVTPRRAGGGPGIRGVRPGSAAVKGALTAYRRIFSSDASGGVPLDAPPREPPADLARLGG
jgi:hypothetical protein